MVVVWEVVVVLWLLPPKRPMIDKVFSFKLNGGEIQRIRLVGQGTTVKFDALLMSEVR